jgi:hypothetical protein
MSNKPNCLTCRHLSHDAERIPVCGQVYGWIACQHCKRIQSPIEYSIACGGMLCSSCNRGQPHLVKNDWREGYVGDGVGDHVTPIPCCPGWEELEEVVVKVDRQRGLFEQEGD